MIGFKESNSVGILLFSTEKGIISKFGSTMVNTFATAMIANKEQEVRVCHSKQYSSESSL